MAEGNQLITIIIVIVVILLIIWAIGGGLGGSSGGKHGRRHKKKGGCHGGCGGCGGCGCGESDCPQPCQAEMCMAPTQLEVTSPDDFKVHICWQAPPCDVDHYKVFIKYGTYGEGCEIHESCASGAHKVVQVPGHETHLTLHPVKEECVCASVVAVNKCGVPSAESSVECVRIDCNVTTDAWITKSDCTGLSLEWKKVDCAVKYHVYYQSGEDDPEHKYDFPADARGASNLEPIVAGAACPEEPDEVTVYISVETECGEGDLVEASHGAPVYAARR